LHQLERDIAAADAHLPEHVVLKVERVAVVGVFLVRRRRDPIEAVVGE
jgi:hypothetical protein